ncbi:ubiquitin C-terminal hydrolase 12-like [Argentina anserina]|uniref:ubiquitin C-terminal hydrolase 12-like n=1 Tax=Argentina anserina TaxID=57926 RepID=UPI0021763B82|nr:ubiquitin C-terminal hydrolase 12-like [Potentilla anserina]
MSGEVGFDKLVSLTDFTDASNGCLMDDKCVFGAEVYVCNGRRVPRADCLSIRKTTSKKYKHTWKINFFSNLTDNYYTKQFTAGGRDWKILLYHEGTGNGNGTHISLYFGLADPKSFPDGTKLSTNFSLRILDQVHGRHYTSSWQKTLLSSSRSALGWPRLIGLDDFRREDKWCLKSDTCFLEAELTIDGTAMVLNT